MFYDIGSVSNRNLQMLYLYRILREPSDWLTAICRQGSSINVDGLTWVKSSREIEGFDEVYQAKLEGVSPISNMVPFLEFSTEDSDWRWLADFIDLEVIDNSVVLYSASNYLSNISVSVHWCYSLRHISSLLEDLLRDLNALSSDYDNLKNLISNFKDNGAYLTRPEGLVPNLVKISRTNDFAGLVDSGYRVRTAERNRLYVNLSQDNLDTMEHIFNDSVEFRFLEEGHYVVDNFTTPVLVISGNGDLVLRNISGQVLVRNWEGTITVADCADVHLTASDESDICTLTKLQISKGSCVYLENQVHQIEEVCLLASSTCRHWRANVRRLSYVGPGCTYWCCAQVFVPGRIQLPVYDYTSNTVFDFAIHDILGSFVCDFDNIMIVGQKNLTTRLGNHDPDPAPGMYVPYWRADYITIVPGGDPGTGSLSEITIDGLTCWVWIPDKHDNVGLILCCPGYNSGIQEATELNGAWCAVELVRPRAACLFLQRPSPHALPSKVAVMETIVQLQTSYNLGTKLWFYGFSQGANDFDTVCHWAQFKGAVLVDANSIGFSTTGLEKVMAVQGLFNLGPAYDAKLKNLGIDYKLYNFHGQATHGNVNYWTPSDSDATYREIAAATGSYSQLPDNPPNGLIWLCGGRAIQ